MSVNLDRQGAGGGSAEEGGESRRIRREATACEMAVWQSSVASVTCADTPLMFPSLSDEDRTELGNGGVGFKMTNCQK